MDSLDLKKAIESLVGKFAEETKVFPLDIKINWVHTVDNIAKITRIDIIYKDETRYL
jgi:hypothetical protein